MPTNAKTKAKQAGDRKARRLNRPPSKDSRGMNAVELLEQDHREVEEYFDDFEDANENEKGLLAAKICLALTVHAQIEEEIFYPAARKATKDDDLLDEAAVEHAGAKELIAQIESMKPGDDLYDAKVKVLGEYIKHHVKEEEGELFPEAEQARMDLDAVGQALAQRKTKLMAQLGPEARKRAGLAAAE
jgi:hemerythrin superfamily protein